MNNIKERVFRGDIFYADLGLTVGSEQGGIRPVLIIQNNVGNKFSPTTLIAPITSQITKARLPTHIELNANEYGLSKNSIILCEQVRVIDKSRLKEKMGKIEGDFLNQIKFALNVSFDLA
jgi:mRNA interferase MazF